MIYIGLGDSPHVRVDEGLILELHIRARGRADLKFRRAVLADASDLVNDDACRFSFQISLRALLN